MSNGRSFRASRASVLVLALAALSHGPLAAQEVPLRRDIPAPQPRECPFGVAPSPADPADAEEAGRLATAATRAAILGEHVEARDLLARAIVLDPASETVAFRYARTLEELGELEPAIREYCRFVNIAGDTPEAREIRERVRQLAPRVRPGISDRAVGHFEAAMAAYDDGRLEDTERSLSAVVEEAPTWSSPLFDRGIVRAALSRREGALADFERFLELEPGAPERERVLRWTTQLRDAAGARFSPATAFFAGLIPGVGHYYTKRPVMGTFLLALAGGAVGAGLGYEVTHVDCLGIPQNGTCPPNQVLDERTERPLLVPGLAIGAAASILGAIDAALGARRRNARPPAIRLSGGEDGDGIRLLAPAARYRDARLDVAWVRLEF